VDLETRDILFATEGKDASTVERFRQDLTDHGGDPEAQLTFDTFHVMKIINEAVDEVRRGEQKIRPELAGTRYMWLRNQENLKKSQNERLEELTMKKLNLKTSRAYHLKLNFQELFTQPADLAEPFLKKWYYWATHSRLEPIKKIARTIKRHWDGILRWFHSNISNCMLKGLNSLVQLAKSKVRGYRSTRNLIAIILGDG